MAFLSLGFVATAQAAPANLGPAVKLVLTTKRVLLDGTAKACADCHNPNGDEGTDLFADILNLDELKSSGAVVPGNPERSKLYAAITRAHSRMPLGGNKLPDAEIALVKDWISSGATSFEDAAADSSSQASDTNTPTASTTPPPRLISEVNRYHLMAKDIATVNPRSRRFVRYFSLTHLYDAGRSAEQIAYSAQALSRLLNSLSWTREITNPEPIDGEKTIYRIDLRDYGWESSLWDKLAAADPYSVSYSTPDAKILSDATGTSLPVLRGDWFVAVASVPPFYYEILRLPKTTSELENLLTVGVENDLNEDKALRAGMSRSGVSQNNRVIERHASPYGAYWKSYDFASSTGLSNIFSNPLGPCTNNAQAPSLYSQFNFTLCSSADSELLSHHVFRHDAGEIIFNLPNGFQAYYLANGQGNRLDTAPLEIVSDPLRPDRRVTNGQSCMRCHSDGMLRANDQVQLAIAQNPGSFSETEKNNILGLYQGQGALDKAFTEDERRFNEAVLKTGGAAHGPDPVFALYKQYENDVDLTLASAEVGLEPKEFLDKLKSSSDLLASLAPLTLPDGAVQRQTFLDAFPSIAQLVFQPENGDQKTSWKRIRSASAARAVTNPKFVVAARLGDLVLSAPLNLDFGPGPKTPDQLIEAARRACESIGADLPSVEELHQFQNLLPPEKGGKSIVVRCILRNQSQVNRSPSTPGQLPTGTGEARYGDFNKVSYPPAPIFKPSSSGAEYRAIRANPEPYSYNQPVAQSHQESMPANFAWSWKVAGSQVGPDGFYYVNPRYKWSSATGILTQHGDRWLNEQEEAAYVNEQYRH